MSFLKCSIAKLVEAKVAPIDPYIAEMSQKLSSKKLKNLHILSELEENKIFTIDDQYNKKLVLKVVKAPLSYNNEVQALKDLQKEKAHPNIIALIDSFIINGQKDNHCLLLEYIDGHDLFELREKCGYISADVLTTIFKQITDAMVFVHETGYAHMDIKPENIMYSPMTNTAKLIDFGATRSNKIEVFYWTGTPGFIAPETLFNYMKLTIDLTEKYPYLENVQLDIEVLKKIDVWAFGVTLHDMIYEILPYGATLEDEYRQILAQLRGGELYPKDVYYNETKPQNIDLLKQVTYKSLCIDYRNRVSFKDIRKILCF